MFCTLTSKTIDVSPQDSVNSSIPASVSSFVLTVISTSLLIPASKSDMEVSDKSISQFLASICSSKSTVKGVFPIFLIVTV